jgi:hypothetical protein
MQSATRRNLLLGSAGAAALASMGQLSGCSSPTPGGNSVLPAVIDAITKAIAGVCAVIPAVTTLVDIIVAVFPAAAGVGTIADTLVQQIAQYVCNLFKQAGAEHGDIKEGAVFNAKVKDTTVPLHGYTVSNGKLVSF